MGPRGSPVPENGGGRKWALRPPLPADREVAWMEVIARAVIATAYAGL